MTRRQVKEKIKKIRRVNGSIRPRKKVDWDNNSFFKVRPISLGKPITSSSRLNRAK